MSADAMNSVSIFCLFVSSTSDDFASGREGLRRWVFSVYESGTWAPSNPLTRVPRRAPRDHATACPYR